MCFQEETVFNGILAGLRDQELKEKCHTAAVLKQVKDIPSLIQFFSADEASKSRGFGRVSNFPYKKSKEDSTRRTASDGPPSPETRNRCPNCSVAGAAVGTPRPNARLTTWNARPVARGATSRRFAAPDGPRE